jgi:Fur family ferric uptake transcriptional regulator
MKKSLPEKLDVEQARAVLQRVKLRCTAARIAVVQCLHAAKSPVTPIEVASELKSYGFDKSTIYRTLTELNDVGVVTRLDLGDSVRRFEMLTEDGHGAAAHPHFMCVDCGEVVCLSDFTVELKAGSKRSRSPGVIEEVLVRGHCESCCT